MKAGPESRRFRVKATSVPSSKPGAWGWCLVKIFDGDTEIGEYTRNHPNLSFAEQTFEPFELGGAWYALYSRDYTSTRLMRLPDCKDLGGEERDEAGFCPVEFFVPRYKKVVWTKRATGRESGQWSFESEAEGHSGHETRDHGYDYTYGPWLSLETGFVAGCVWGDDATWKLQVIELSRATEGIIVRSARFGHLELGKMPLVEAISLDCHMPHWELRATIIRLERRRVATGELIDPYE